VPGEAAGQEKPLRRRLRRPREQEMRGVIVGCPGNVCGYGEPTTLEGASGGRASRATFLRILGCHAGVVRCFIFDAIGQMRLDSTGNSKTGARTH
jgi:hypothetical protein